MKIENTDFFNEIFNIRAMTLKVIKDFRKINEVVKLNILIWCDFIHYLTSLL